VHFSVSNGEVVFEQEGAFYAMLSCADLIYVISDTYERPQIYCLST